MEKEIENIEQNTKIAKVTLERVIDRHGVAAEIFGALGQHGVNVELISTSSVGHNRANISFAILESFLDDVLKLLETIKDKFGADKVSVDKGCALITVYGTKLSTTPGIAGRIFKDLSEHGVNIEMISASLSVLSIVVKKEKVAEAVEAIKASFST
jgi:aspartate kinase